MHTHVFTGVKIGRVTSAARRRYPNHLDRQFFASYYGKGALVQPHYKILKRIAAQNDEALSERGLVHVNHGLVEMVTGKDGNVERRIVKYALMTRREARGRNKVLAGTGYSWAACNPISGSKVQPKLVAELHS